MRRRYERYEIFSNFFNPLLANVPIYHPLTTLENFGFLMFSGGIKRVHWPEMDRNLQKQPSELFCKKNIFLKIRKFHRKTTVLESLFNKVAGLCSFIKKRLQHRCFPVKFTKPLRLPILKNICERLLLNLVNPFHFTDLFLYSLKKWQNHSAIERYRKRQQVVWCGLITLNLTTSWSVLQNTTLNISENVNQKYI